MSDPLAPELLFSTPLFHAALDGLDGAKAGVVAEVTELMQAHPTADGRSVRGGWHSGALFSKGAPPHIRGVLGKAVAYAREALGPAYDGWSRQRLQLGSAWASVLGPQAYNAPHHHRPQVWSAVVWIQVPPPPDDAPTGAGCLELFHPAPADDPWGRGSALLTPREGHIALFPGHLLHAVHPHGSPAGGKDALRIALAFNMGALPAR